MLHGAYQAKPLLWFEASVGTAGTGPAAAASAVVLVRASAPNGKFTRGW